MSPFGGKAEAIGHKADIGAASAGVLDTPFGKFARLQILTIEDLFAGKKPAMPPEDPTAFKRAAREEDKTRQGKLI
jgi:hypothetical protein